MALVQIGVMKRVPTVEDLEAISSDLSEGLKAALRSARTIMEQRARENGLIVADLDDRQLLDYFTDAFIEAAPTAYAGLDRDTVQKVLRAMFSSIVTNISAAAESSRSIN